MNQKLWRSLIATVLAVTVVITCTVAGLVLPASAKLILTGDNLIANGDFETDAAWTTVGGTSVGYVTDAGVSGNALRVDRGYPVSQALSTALSASTGYVITGSVKAPATAEYVRVTVKDGNTVLFATTVKATADWASLGDELAFETPASVGNVTVMLEALMTENEESATVPEETVVGGNLDFGEGEVEDNDEDISGNQYVYVDNLALYEGINIEMGDNVDLTVTNVTWAGDTDNDGQVPTGTAVTFVATVKNVGTDAIPADIPFTVDFAVNRDVVQTATYSAGIAAGASVSITAPAAWTATAGEHVISARVDANNDIPELKETTDQTYQLGLRVGDDVITPGAGYSNVADLVAQAGMDRLTMSDDFDTLDSIDTTASGAEGYKWYVTRPWGATTMTTSDYEVFAADGYTRVKAQDASYNLYLNSVDVNTKNGYHFKWGYIETRFRIVDPDIVREGESGYPAIWSFTQDKALEGADKTVDQQWVEIDWMEYYGQDSTKYASYPDGYYTTTLHDSIHEGSYNGYAYSSSNYSYNGLGDTDNDGIGEWHVMGWLWQENSIRGFIDGKEYFNFFYDKDASSVPAPNPKTTGAASTDVGMFSWANYEDIVMYIGGSADHPLDVDYFRVWQSSTPATVSDSMTMSETNVTLDEGDRHFLTATATDGSDLGALTWKSSNPTVATVHGNGEVYARSTGTTVITAANKNGTTVTATVKVTNNLITGGDFDWYGEPFDNDLLYQNWTYGCLKNGYTIDNDSGNYYLKVPSGSSTYYYFNLPVKQGKTYRLTGQTKRSGWALSPKAAFVINPTYVQTGASNELQVSSSTSSFKDFSLEFTVKTAEQLGTTEFNANYILGFRTGSYNTYYDNLKLVEVTDATTTSSSFTVTEGAVSGGTLKVDKTTAAEGDIVTVTVPPSDGYRLAPGGLTYTYKVGTRTGDKTVTRNILSTDLMYTQPADFYGNATGYKFVFKMPAANVTVNATFEEVGAATTDLPAATLGTSVYQTSAGITGVRFLNRVYLTEWTKDSKELYVTVGTETKKITKFGSLLKRSSNSTELTLENYEAHKNDSGATKIWNHTAYKGGNYGVVDYAEDAGYLDFTITMTTSKANNQTFLYREYDICAYFVLEDGTTIYTDVFTDSAIAACERQ